MPVAVPGDVVCTDTFWIAKQMSIFLSKTAFARSQWAATSTPKSYGTERLNIRFDHDFNMVAHSIFFGNIIVVVLSLGRDF